VLSSITWKEIPEPELRQISRVFDLVADTVADVPTPWLFHIADGITLKSNAALFGFRRLIEWISSRKTSPNMQSARFARALDDDVFAARQHYLRRDNTTCADDQ
jgi:hypothetical protein